MESVTVGCIVEVDCINVERILACHSSLTYQYGPFVETAQMLGTLTDDHPSKIRLGDPARLSLGMIASLQSLVRFTSQSHCNFSDRFEKTARCPSSFRRCTLGCCESFRLSTDGTDLG